ncbi:ABC-2 family transporter protein [Bacillus sp. A116_S68]|jgi:ABC-2 type transport system permease protein|nr:ABC-2 family transporter protein [Bacillus sp. A116_S68]
MKKYFELFKSQIQINSAYSAWYWAGTFSTILRLLIIYYFWTAVYENNTTVQGIPLNQMVTYFVVAMLLGNYFASMINTISSHVREGNLAIELIKPYDYLFKMTAVDLGDKISATIRDNLPMFLLAWFLLNIQKPPNMWGLSLFIISAIIGALIVNQFDLMCGVITFWTVNSWGVYLTREALFMLLSGTFIPLMLLPVWVQNLLVYLPFPSMIYVPTTIYTGQMATESAIAAIGVQVLWLVVLFVLVRLLWFKARRNIEIFGG